MILRMIELALVLFCLGAAYNLRRGAHTFDEFQDKDQRDR